MSQARRASLGIDVAKAKFDAALLGEGKLAQRTFSMDPAGFAALESWIGEHGVEQVHACLEATGEYGAALALFLYESGHLVSIVNPARIAAYAKSRLARTKTDKSDAALIARFCAHEQPPVWTPPSAEVHERPRAGPARRDAAGHGTAGGESPAEWRLLACGAHRD
jgi:transposase